ncbi:TolC family protein [Aeromonas sanarellii]|uniref:TolC family protein n=1 Tax=Aeromonas sanarellii TaxID=633415 RepID=UPI003B9E48B8
MTRCERYFRRHDWTVLCALTLFVVFSGGAQSADEPALTKAPSISPPYHLDDLLQAGVEGNVRIASGRSSVEAAEQLRSAAWQNYLPTPSIQADSNQDGGSEVILSLQQPLWAGGRIDAGVDAASANAESAIAAVSEEQYNVALSIIDYFGRYVQSRARQEALERFNQRLGVYRTRMTNRVSSGASPENDMALLEARVATTAARLKSVRSDGEVALTQLSQLTNLPLDSRSIVFEFDHPPLLAVDEVLSLARRYNPTLNRLTHDIASAEASVRAQRSVMMPNVSLVLSHNMYYGTSRLNDDTSIGIQVQVQPGAGLSAYANTQAAVAQLQSLRFKRDATELELLANIRSAHESLLSAVSRQADTELNAQAAANVLSSYERLFIAGKRSWLDVMNAARDLSDADIAVADNEAERLGLRYRIDLYAAKYQWMKKAP